MIPAATSTVEEMDGRWRTFAVSTRSRSRGKRIAVAWPPAQVGPPPGVSLPGDGVARVRAMQQGVGYHKRTVRGESLVE